MIDEHHGWNASVKPVILGFIFSMILLFGAHRIVTERHLSEGVQVFFLTTFVSIQALIQFVFFFHLGLESKPRWNLGMFLLTLLLVAIIIGGSIWIMVNIRNNVMVNM